MFRTLCRALALFALANISLAPAAEWPRFLGPEGNGIVDDDSQLSADWNAHPPRKAWEFSVGRGCSSFAVADGKALTLGNEDKRDTVWCFDAPTGKVLWKHAYEERLGAKWYSGGPSATPTIDGDRVYTVSKSGKLFCLDLSSGSVHWQIDYEADLNGRSGGWGWAASPVVYGKLLLVDPGAKDGALVALDKLTGEVQWRSGTDEAAYATPVIFRHQGKDAVALFHEKAMGGYDLENQGAPLFRYAWRTSHGINASNPHYRDGKLFLGSGYGSGYAVIDISSDPPVILHRNRDHMLKMQTSLLLGDRVIAHFGGDGKPDDLRAIDFDSGETLWNAPMPGDMGNVIAIGQYLIVFTSSGHVVLGRDQGDAFQELGRYSALAGPSWAPPAYANGRLYLRNNQGQTVCLDVSK